MRIKYNMFKIIKNQQFQLVLGIIFGIIIGLFFKERVNSDINKTQKQIDKKQKQIDKIDAKIDKLYDETGDTSKTIPEEYTQQKSTES